MLIRSVSHFRSRTVGVVLVLVLSLISGFCSAEDGEGTTAALDDRHRPFAAVELHGSLISDIADRSLLSGTFGYALRGGYRWSNWSAILQIEHNMWVRTELERELTMGVVNLGVGVELISGDGYVKTSLVLGPSMLLFDTFLDDAGTTGIFLDFRPLGLRWEVHEHLTLGLDPLAFELVAPVLDGIPLVYPQYRTFVYLEGF